MKYRCPVCQNPLIKTTDYACQLNHHFDIAKSGYLNLSRKDGKSGDNPAMITARTNFLQTNAYQFLQSFLKEKIQSLNINTFVDLGCGEGYYTSLIPCQDKVGIDLSKSAIQYASKHDKTTQYIVGSIFQTPLFDETIDLALACFVPIPTLEVERILKQGGYLITVAGDCHHLFELKQVLYEKPYENTVKPLITNLQLIDEFHIEQPFTTDTQTMLNLFQMTPYAYKTGKDGIEKIKNTDLNSITAAFVIRIYQKI